MTVRRSISIGGEAVDEAGTAGALEGGLAASARAMGGVPRLHVPGVLESLAIRMTKDGRAFAALRPVPASGIAAGGREHTFGIRTGENVMGVDRVAAAADHLAFLGQRGLLGEII